MIENKRRFMKNKIIILLCAIVLLLPIASAEHITEDAKYIGFDRNFGVHQLSVNISVKEPVNLVYVENYYGIDSSGKSKFYSSNRFYSSGVINKLHLNIQRPRHRYGNAYFLVEKVFIINGNRTTHWVNLKDYYLKD